MIVSKMKVLGQKKLEGACLGLREAIEVQIVFVLEILKWKN